jgi:hypothetical protein
MSNHQDTAHLTQVNSELRASLKRCRILLDQCRSQLAANSNEPEDNEGDEEERAVD